MVRGCEKRVVFLKNTGSEYFEEAYFVLCSCADGISEKDMIAEANRIIEDAENKRDNRKARILSRSNVISFVSGLVISSLAFTITILAIL